MLKPNFMEWEVECKKGLLVDATTIDIKLPYRQRRCELVNHDWLQLDQPFQLSFNLEPLTLNTEDGEWHIIGQIHSFPDPGENWRCPILSLEVKNGMLRMYNRWDDNHISKTPNGPCATKDNTIKSRLVFKDYQLELHKRYDINIKGKLSFRSDGWLTIYVNGEKVGDIQGATAFNDKRGPYLKLGVYKPTRWVSIEKPYYRYTNIRFQRTFQNIL